MNFSFLSLILFSTSIFAKDPQFEGLWDKINIHSNALKSSSEQLEAAKLNLTRNEKHWMPTIYLTGQSYLTNDSGAYLFGLLSQKKIEQNDFNTSTLNDPGTNHFTKGSLGINFSIYEGGMKEAISKASSFQFKSRQSDDNKNKIDFYSEVAKNYFSYLALGIQKNELTKVEAALISILSNYHIGNKGNLVGYSGLLGLKSLRSRLDAIKDENESKAKAFNQALNTLANSNDKIKVSVDLKIQKIVDEYLNSNNNYQPSEKIKSFEYNSMAASEMIAVESSRNLPRIGLFAEGNLFNGKRDTASGFATGLYVNWNLISGDDLGRTSEAVHQSYSAKYYAQAMFEKEKIEFDSQNIAATTLSKTLLTLEESQKLLDEQMNISNKLFNNGMINALQLTEVLNRRIDLINSKTEVELKLIEAKAKVFTLSNNKIEINN